MKNYNYLATLMFVAMFSLVMSSCLGNDDEPRKQIDPIYYKHVSGSYSGFVQYLVNWETKEFKKEDGINMTVTPDSTIKITGIPAAVFAKNIKDEKIKAAISALPSPTLSVRFLIVDVNANGVAMYSKPLPLEFKGVIVDGKSHDYLIRFYGPSLAGTTPDYSKFSLNAYLYSFHEDGLEKEKFIKKNNVVNENTIIFVECQRAK